MQMGRPKLSMKEHHRHLQEGRCFYRGQQGHLLAACPAKGHSSTERPLRALTEAKVKHGDTSENLGVLIDSRADESVIDWDFALGLELRSERLAQPLEARALDGTQIFKLTHKTEPFEVFIGDHHKFMSFHLYRSSQHPHVLGFPWLKKHNPHIDWSARKILNWSEYCKNNCLNSSHNFNVQSAFNSASVNVATDRPYDYPIDLIPWAPIPKGRLYSLSDKKAMTDYIASSLKAGLICPSSSPARAGFFFVGKKDGTLRPCIDYAPLNNITIKIRYPLPLTSSAFDQLQQAKIFAKLDLRNAYHLVHIREEDKWKIGFNTPNGHYEYLVMPFGLTNAPAVFQVMINDVFRDFLNHFVYVYLDDILIFSSDLDSHVSHVC